MQLETLFGARFNSNAEIIATIKKLSEAGKFDEPKKVAVFAIILDRLGKMEDEELVNEALKEPGIIDNREWAENEEAKARERFVAENVAPQPDNQPAPQIDTPPSAPSDVPATPETPVTPVAEPVVETPPVATPETVPTPPVDTTTDVTTPPATDTAPTVSNFTPENITDPVTPDSTTP